jgi:hypothetical protein
MAGGYLANGHQTKKACHSDKQQSFSHKMFVFVVPKNAAKLLLVIIC